MRYSNILLQGLTAILLCILTCTSAYAQQTSAGAVSGKVADKKTNRLLEFAVVRVLHKDSSLVKNTLTNKAGEFSISKLSAGSYILNASFVGYKQTYRPFVISAEKPVVDAGTILLEEGIELKEVSVVAETPPVVVKGDTTEHNASSYKLTPDAMTEDLLKKLPGVQVDRAGNITSDGDRVSKVTVEGRDFFGNDPKVATRNLPADAIDKVQVIEDKTEQAKASGIDDGRRVKKINLVLKKDKKQGWFGNSSLSGGTSDRYLGSASINHFTNDVQFNALVGSNNMSQGYSTDEATNFNGGSSSGSMMSSGNSVSRSIGGVPVGNVMGINTTSSGGINYSNLWGKKNQIKYNSSYHLSGTSSITEQLQGTETIQPGGVFTSQTATSGKRDVLTHQFYSTLNTPIDKLTTLYFNPIFSINLNNSGQSHKSFQLSPQEQKMYDVNRNTSQHSLNPAFEGYLSLSRRMPKGTISLSVSGNFSKNSSDNINRSDNTYYQTGFHQLFNRQENQDAGNNTIAVRNSFNRILSADRKKSLSITNTIDASSVNSDQNTLEYDPLTGKYELPVDSLSNRSVTRTTRYSSSPGYSRPFWRGTLALTANLQYTVLNGNIVNDTQQDHIKREYFSAIPTVSYSFGPKPERLLTLNASGRLTPPNLNDLVTIQNNLDPLYIREGNPDLNPYRSYGVTFTYRASNRKKGTNTNLSGGYSANLSSIGRSNTLDTASGIRTSRPVNVRGGYGYNLSGSRQFPKIIKGMSSNASFNMRTGKNIGFINGLKNYTNSLGGGARLSMNYAWKEWFITSLSSSVNYTRYTNSAANAINSNILNLENTFDLSLEPVKSWMIKTDVSQFSYSGRNAMLVNASIQKFFTEKRKLSLELKAFDLLNRNTILSRYVTANQITSSTSNNISRFFYLKMTYKVNKLGPAKPAPVR